MPLPSHRVLYDQASTWYQREDDATAIQLLQTSRRPDSRSRIGFSIATRSDRTSAQAEYRWGRTSPIIQQGREWPTCTVRPNVPAWSMPRAGQQRQTAASQLLASAARELTTLHGGGGC